MWITELVYHTFTYFLIPLIIVSSGIITHKLYKMFKKGKLLILLSYLPMLVFSFSILFIIMFNININLVSISYLCYTFTFLHFLFYSYMIYCLFCNNFIYSPIKKSVMLILLFIFQSFIGSVATSMIFFSYYS